MNWNDPLVIVLGLLGIAVLALVLMVALPQFPGLKDLLVGVATSPQVVGIFRALLVYVVPVALGSAVAYVNGWTDPRLLPLVPLILGGLRSLEAAFDNWRKPHQNEGGGGVG